AAQGGRQERCAGAKRRSCPTCGAVLSPDNLQSARAFATCRACSPVTAGDPVGAPGVGTRAPPAPLRRPRQAVRRPRHFSVKDSGTSLRILFCWIWCKFVGPAMMCLAWNSFLVGWYWSALRTPETPFMWLALLITIPHGAIGLLLVYATLAGLLNRTVIKI